MNFVSYFYVSFLFSSYFLSAPCLVLAFGEFTLGLAGLHKTGI